MSAHHDYSNGSMKAFRHRCTAAGETGGSHFHIYNYHTGKHDQRLTETGSGATVLVLSRSTWLDRLGKSAHVSLWQDCILVALLEYYQRGLCRPFSAATREDLNDPEASAHGWLSEYPSGSARGMASMTEVTYLGRHHFLWNLPAPASETSTHQDIWRDP